MTFHDAARLVLLELAFFASRDGGLLAVSGDGSLRLSGSEASEDGAEAVSTHRRQGAMKIEVEHGGGGGNRYRTNRYAVTSAGCQR